MIQIQFLTWVLLKYLYEIKQHQRQHVIYGGHVLGKSIHDPAWRELKKFCQHGREVNKWKVKQREKKKDLSSWCWALPWGLVGQRWASAHEAFWKRWVMCALTGDPWRNPRPEHSPTWLQRCIWCSMHWLVWRWLPGGWAETKNWGAAHLCSWVMMGWLRPSRLCWSKKRTG